MRFSEETEHGLNGSCVVMKGAGADRYIQRCSGRPFLSGTVLPSFFALHRFPFGMPLRRAMSACFRQNPDRGKQQITGVPGYLHLPLTEPNQHHGASSVSVQRQKNSADTKTVCPFLCTGKRKNAMLNY